MDEEKEYESNNKPVIESCINLIIQAEVAEALSVKSSHKPSSHGNAANKVREYMSDKELIDLHLGNDVSELESLAKSLDIE